MGSRGCARGGRGAGGCGSAGARPLAAARWRRPTMPRPAALPRLLLLVLPAALDTAAGGSDPMGGGERCCGVAPVDPMRRIFSWSGPGPPLTAPLAAARGELVHLQAVVALPPASVGSAAPGAVTTMTASAASLGAPVTVRRVGYLNLTRTFSAERPTGLYPALLLPPSYMYGNATDSTRPAAGAPTVFWLSMSIPRGAAPGLHRGVINATVAAAAPPGSSGGSTTTCRCSAAFTVEVSRWSIPAAPTQLTGAMFESKYVAEFSPRQVYSPETALNFFASFAAQRVNSFAWFELDGPNTPSQADRPRLPWARSRAASVPPVAAMIFSLPGASRAARRRRARGLAAVRRSPARGAPRRRRRPCAGYRCNETLACTQPAPAARSRAPTSSGRRGRPSSPIQNAAPRLPRYVRCACCARTDRPRTPNRH